MGGGAGLKASSVVPARQQVFEFFFTLYTKNKSVYIGMCTTVAAAVECKFQGKKQKKQVKALVRVFRRHSSRHKTSGHLGHHSGCGPPEIGNDFFLKVT